MRTRCQVALLATLLLGVTAVPAPLPFLKPCDNRCRMRNTFYNFRRDHVIRLGMDTCRLCTLGNCEIRRNEDGKGDCVPTPEDDPTLNVFNGRTRCPRRGALLYAEGRVVLRKGDDPMGDTVNVPAGTFVIHKCPAKTDAGGAVTR